MSLWNKFSLLSFILCATCPIDLWFWFFDLECWTQRKSWEQQSISEIFWAQSRGYRAFLFLEDLRNLVDNNCFFLFFFPVPTISPTLFYFYICSEMMLLHTCFHTKHLVAKPLYLKLKFGMNSYFKKLKNLLNICNYQIYK